MTVKVILKVNDETGQPMGAVQSVDFQRHGATVILLGCNYDSVPFSVTEEGFEIGYRDWETDRKSTRLNSSHSRASRMPSSA